MIGRVAVSLWSVNDRATSMLNERLLPPDARTRNRPGGSAATGTVGDVAGRELLCALLLGGVYDAGGLVIRCRCV
jgi:hypothetical protein